MRVARNLPDRSSPARGGFTLIELMVVVLIIAILIGLILPAIMGARSRARDAEVRSDISKLEQAIAQFKVDFGVEPPSHIVLSATDAGWDNQSRGLIRRIWPRFDFANCGGASNGMVFTLPNGNTQTTPHDLNGAECLVFFLGGMINPGSGAFYGFSKDPAHPFDVTITNRQGPYFEFVGALILQTPMPPSGNANWNGRLTDVDGDWLPEYHDPLPQQTNPYLYFSAATGNYRTNGYPPGPWVNPDCQPLINHAYYNLFQPNLAPAMSTPYKPRGFQIISPGPDTVYGTGGAFDPDNTNALGPYDRDNITNFHPGRLGN